MTADAAALDDEAAMAAKKFVDTLARVLLARRTGSASISLRAQLAGASVDARKLLNSKQYRDAVYKAARLSGDFQP